MSVFIGRGEVCWGGEKNLKNWYIHIWYVRVRVFVHILCIVGRGVQRQSIGGARLRGGGEY